MRKYNLLRHALSQRITIKYLVQQSIANYTFILLILLAALCSLGVDGEFWIFGWLVCLMLFIDIFKTAIKAADHGF